MSGTRLANNQMVTPTSLTSVSAYVQQDDLFIGTLTVKEHLIFQALVRMDADIPKKMRYQKVDDIIKEVQNLDFSNHKSFELLISVWTIQMC